MSLKCYVLCVDNDIPYTGIFLTSSSSHFYVHFGHEHAPGVTPQKYPKIFIIILLYILGMNWAKLGFFRENDDLTNYEIANLVNPEI